MIVLIRAIKQENEICVVCRNRGRKEDFRNAGYIDRRKDSSRKTVHGWKTIIKWLINEEELKQLELISLTQGMTAVGLSWTPFIGRFGYTKLKRFLDLLSNC
jgi:hypothetical protein